MNKYEESGNTSPGIWDRDGLSLAPFQWELLIVYYYTMSYTHKFPILSGILIAHTIWTISYAAVFTIVVKRDIFFSSYSNSVSFSVPQEKENTPKLEINLSYSNIMIEMP